MLAGPEWKGTAWSQLLKSLEVKRLNEYTSLVKKLVAFLVWSEQGREEPLVGEACLKDSLVRVNRGKKRDKKG